MACSMALSNSLAAASCTPCVAAGARDPSSSSFKLASPQLLGTKLQALSSFSLSSRPATDFQQLTVCKVSKGDVAPPFSLKDQNGRSVSLSQYKGKPVVLYFYPADETPGCTKQKPKEIQCSD